METGEAEAPRVHEDNRRDIDHEKTSEPASESVVACVCWGAGGGNETYRLYII